MQILEKGLIIIENSYKGGFDALKSYISGKSVTLAGIGISNAPLAALLLRCGASRITARDRKDKSEIAAAAELEALGVTLITGDDYLSGIDENIIIKAPGIRPDLPEFLEAVSHGATLTGETELFVYFCPARIFGVTGSDGKSTTTTLISEFLKTEGYKTHLGGNIGRPLLASIDEIGKDDMVALELSSFQLMTMRRAPEVAVITNLSENHLNWHTSMGEYLDAKRNILKNQSEGSRSVLNLDNEHTKNAAGDVRGELLWFSLEKRPDKGVWLEGDTIKFTDGKEVCEIIKASDIKLPGRHNTANYMTAIAATRGFVSNASVLKVAREFGGVAHRLELIREFEGVKYYNSSIDSSPARTTAALSSFNEKVIVICGGYDKHLDYTPLGKVFSDHVKAAVLCGATSDKIYAAITGFEGYTEDDCPLYRESDFKKAVLKAKSIAYPGDKVVLTPASASFDMFKNFEERGDTFRKIVKEFS